jgi:hypothetical protein
MWSDELDKKMRGATEGSYPAYEERAWVKMEKLLDQHLPQKRRRRFIPLLLVSLALVGTGIFFVIQQHSKNNVTAENIKHASPITPGEDVQNRKESGQALTTPLREGPTEQIDRTATGTKDIEAVNARVKPVAKSPIVSPQQTVASKTTVTQQSDGPDKLTTVEGNKQTSNKQPKAIVEGKSISTVNMTDSPSKSVADIPATQKPAASEIKDSEQLKDTSKKSPSKTTGSRGSNFAFTLSAGPDFSSLYFSEPGEVRMAYGVGVIYLLSKKISLRTGFYAGRKIYTADPDDYQSNYNPPPTLQKIEANCLVYEIPLNVLYSFPKLKKHNWFIGGGLSSYLMKEETYDYVHKYSSGQVHYVTREYKNENAHFFSVANISGGYQYHFSDRFSMMAEPYVKIPLTGIGQGKVQLNSAGILFTAAFKPFFRKN